MRRTTLKCIILLLTLSLIISYAIEFVEAQYRAQDKTTSATERLSPSDILRVRAEAREKANAPLRQTQVEIAKLSSLATQRKSQDSRLSFSLTSAKPKRGIAGFLVDKNTRAKIIFNSKRNGDYLASRITDQNGVTLVEYTETERAPVAHPLTGEITTEPVPALSVNGITYEEPSGPVADAMNELAASPHGELIRKLAFYLVALAPGDDLETERRGLEVPYQAMQAFYSTPAIDGYGGGELTAARQLGVKRRAISNASKSQEVNELHVEHQPLIPQPIDCERFQCMYVDTHDYQLSEQGGYVVKSLSPRLSLSHNYARPAASTHKGGEDGVIKPMDDGSQVGDCYGRCGGGCGNWSHEWVGTPSVEYGETSCREGYRHPAMEVLCLERCEEESVNPVTYRGTAVHTARGKVTLGAKAHDSCCRSSPLGCADPACIAIAPGALDCFIPFFGSEHTWSYIGYHEANYVEFGADPWTCHERMSECCQQWY